MHYDFDLKIDKVASFSKEDFNVAEKDWLLNTAQDYFLKQRMNTTNVRGTGFEVEQKRIDDLSRLVVKHPEQPDVTPINWEGVYEINLDTQLIQPYFALVQASIQIIKNDSCTVWASLEHTQHDDFNAATIDPFNKSYNKEILYNHGRSSQGTGRSIFIYPQGIDVGQVRLTYVKYPNRINLGGYVYIDGITYPTSNCEFAEPTHTEIVDIAVMIASNIIEHPDYVQLRTNLLRVHE